MNVNPNELRRETVVLTKQIDRQVEVLNLRAVASGVPPHTLVDENGGYLLSPLLQAKAQCLNTLAMLNEPHNRR